MSELAGPTWRRLKSCLEYKFRDIEVPATSHEDRLKQLGLLVGLSKGRTDVLNSERLQLQLGREASASESDAQLAQHVHAMAKQAPLEKYVR